MGLNSVNTNTSAMAALQNLSSTQRDLATTQSRINTGLKVASAKDNGAIWAIAQNQRATSQSLDAVKDSLQRGASTVDVALSAGESVSDLLLQMKSKALAASDQTLDANSRTALNEDFKSLRDQIQKAVDNAEFNGANMLKGGGSTVQALANADGSAHITVGAQDLSLGGSGALSTITVGAQIDTLTNGTGSKALSSHLDFVGKLQDTIDAGVGNLVDADLAKESAKLQALQTKQQLGIQALSIANQSSSILLGLFR
jgi:flagellin